MVHYEKFRAEMLKQFGFVCCTPLCSLFLYSLLNNFERKEDIMLSVLISMFLFAIGLMYLQKSLEVMYELEGSVKDV